MARSASYDERLVKVFNAIEICDQKTQVPVAPAADWTQFYRGNSKLKSYVGPVTLREFEGRGLGLAATCRIHAGDVLLIEDAFALSSALNAPIAQTTAELVSACCNKLGSVATALLEKITFCCLHGSEKQSWKDSVVRKRVFETYLTKLNLGEVDEECLKGLSVPQNGFANDEKSVASIVSSNSRKTECWNPWTLLLDESESLGGLWLAASLFNHSCLGNVVVSYGSFKDGSTLVARAATTIETGEELLHTYVYPFDTVLERQSKLQHVYGFRCSCKRCSIEAPYASVASQLADQLELELQKFSAARGKGMKGARNEMTKVVMGIRSVLASIEKAGKDLSADTRRLWRSQFLWGDHGLAMAAQEAGLFDEAVEAFRSCVLLVALVAPSSEYELKYSMMLAQCISRWALSAPGSNLPRAGDLKEALKHAEEAHSRLYGGGGRHFITRMKRRLEDIYAALKRLQ